MLINGAKDLNSILKNYDSGKADPKSVELGFKMHRHSVSFLLENKHAVPTREDLQEAVDYTFEVVGVVITVENMKDILDLFPAARIGLAVYEGCDASESRDLIYEVVCNFFAGCERPIIGDKVNIDRFIEHLQFQAKEMGYEIKKEFNDELLMQ